MPRRIRRGLIFGRAIHRAFQQYRRKFAKRKRPPTLEERAEWLHHASKGCLDALGVKVGLQGEIPTDGLIVSNHLSYLDVLTIASLAPCIFVSKADVKSWPVFGRLATNGGTIFVKRESKTDAHRVARELEDALRSGVRVVLFPEGTSSNGEKVLRFHAPLFEAAVRANAKITPSALLYEMRDGDPARDICYWGDMTFGTHFINLLKKTGIQARVVVGSPKAGYLDRKQAGAELWCEVAELHRRLREEMRTMKKSGIVGK